MSGGTPAQYTGLTAVVCVIALLVVIKIVVGRLRRARATGSVEAGSVRSSSQAKEIVERLYSFCSDRRSGGSGSGGPDGPGPRVRVRGAARLLTVMRTDRRFDTDPRDDEGYWSFVVHAPGAGPADDLDDADLARGLADILARNGVTAIGAPVDVE